MMKNQLEASGYFIPDIEDIRIGYECEVHWHSTDKGNEWRHYIVEAGQLLKNTTGIRVPYLSKEILEVDGWKEVDGDEYLFGRGVSFFFEKKFGKIPEAGSTDAPFKIIMRYDSVVNHMALQYVGEKGYEDFQQQVFSGFCKDANTLKYILKLLNIK